MVPANKILTVAYGTFSCTLEGFDDPFSTMTDIAEYFRDLAAEDRFFGAEPPTPDMATLRLIAEARANRAVEARPEEGGVTLRPSEQVAAAAAVSVEPAAAEAEAEVPEAEAEAEAPEADVTAQVDAIAAEDTDAAPEIEADTARTEAEDTVDISDTGDDAIDPDDGSVAEKLARIRGLVDADREAEAAYTEDEHSEALGEMGDDTLAAAFAADSEADADAMSSEAEDGSDAEDTFADDTLADDTLADDTLDADIAAMMVPVPEREPEAPVEAAEVAEQVAPEARETPSEPDVAETPQEDEDARTEDEAQAATDAPEQTEAADGADQQEDEAAEPRRQRRIRIRRLRRAEAIGTEAAEAPSEMPTEPAGAPEAEAAQDGPAKLLDDDEAALMSELAAIEAELGRDATGTTPGAAADESGSDDDADLMAELAAIRAEADAASPRPAAAEQIDDASTTETAETKAEAEPEAAAEDEVATAADRPEAEAPATETEAPTARDETDAEVAAEAPEAEEPKRAAPEDRDMERLFAATDSRLSGEDTSRRHANISHLKAAVAARRADSTIEPRRPTDSTSYREDLANSVRPRRAAAPAEARTPRPERPERPAPLVLVSEQRVGENETPAVEAAAPVQPRRAPRQSDAEARETEALRDAPARVADAQDFEEFASERGAVGLPDILEAAAIYAAEVMGQDSFSRPRLLHLAAEAVDELSREDGLRGFGQLLRDGTIRKVSRGEFALGSPSRISGGQRRTA